MRPPGSRVISKFGLRVHPDYRGPELKVYDFLEHHTFKVHIHAQRHIFRYSSVQEQEIHRQQGCSN